MPFKGASKKAIADSILYRDPDYSKPAWRTVSPDARDLITGMLTKDPRLRLKATEVLRHAWLVKNAPPNAVYIGGSYSSLTRSVSVSAATASRSRSTASGQGSDVDASTGASMASCRKVNIEVASLSGYSPVRTPSMETIGSVTSDSNNLGNLDMKWDDLRSADGSDGAVAAGAFEDFPEEEGAGEDDGYRDESVRAAPIYNFIELFKRRWAGLPCIPSLPVHSAAFSQGKTVG